MKTCSRRMREQTNTQSRTEEVSTLLSSVFEQKKKKDARFVSPCYYVLDLENDLFLQELTVMEKMEVGVTFRHQTLEGLSL